MRYFLIFTTLFFTLVFHGQTTSDYSDKVQTMDSTLETLYSVISGEKGEARNWELFTYLFKDGAQLIPTQKNKDGLVDLRYMSPKDYVETSGKWLEENGFFEKEIHRVAHTFGAITEVFSTYESYHSQKDEQPFARGINSIQLLYDGSRWWVVNIYWMQETDEYPIPAKYLPSK